jgi:hypothetical protein
MSNPAIRTVALRYEEKDGAMGGNVAIFDKLYEIALGIKCNDY